ncbi:hypothetical protein B0H14DRAFT_3055905 [Mycena olivaceomarginata]|nr:hypothetical protein B0H14DRAFT_3055905 [Mycena olivaceomarginata]
MSDSRLYSPGDLLNRFGVPEGFEQVYLEPADVASRSQYHRSGSDRRLDVDAGVESNVFLPLGAGAVVEISTSSKETAVLLLPDGASRTDIRRKKRFRVTHLERMVDNGDLYLVTGTDKSASRLPFGSAGLRAHGNGKRPILCGLRSKANSDRGQARESTVFLRGFKAISIVDSKPSEILSKGGSSPFHNHARPVLRAFFSSAPSGVVVQLAQGGSVRLG